MRLFPRWRVSTTRNAQGLNEGLLWSGGDLSSSSTFGTFLFAVGARSLILRAQPSRGKDKKPVFRIGTSRRSGSLQLRGREDELPSHCLGV